MKKILAMLSAATLLLTLAACSSKEETAAAATEEPASSAEATETPAPTESAGMANPNRYDVGSEEMVQVTGITLDVPDDAENVTYNIIGAEEEHPMAEATFSLEGNDFCYRAQSTDLTSLTEDTANISGIYTEWSAVLSMNVDDLSGVLMTSDEATVLAWLDTAPGILYNLTYQGDLNAEMQDFLTTLGEEIFDSMQDDSDGVNLVGEWTEEHKDGEAYAVMTLAEDGSGNILNMPDNIGVPLTYEVDGNTITAHLGSVDDNTPMEYLPDSDQISYNGSLYSRSAA